MGLSALRRRSSWENEKTLRGHLAEQLGLGRLSLILGAGASIDSGFPGWDELIDRCYKKCKIAIPSGRLFEERAEQLLRTKFKGDEARFAELVRTCLYQNASLSFETLRQRSLLASLGALTMASGRGSVTRVVNFNFDNSFETFLRFYGYRVKSVGELPSWASRSDVVVYHPHGLLPYRGRNGAGEGNQEDLRMVFAQSQFDRFLRTAGHHWYSLLIELFSSHTCLFIGISGRDSTLRDALGKIKSYHASQSRKDLFWGIRFCKGDKAAERLFWEEQGVYQRRVRNWEEIPDFLFSICQKSAMNADSESTVARRLTKSR